MPWVPDRTPCGNKTDGILVVELLLIEMLLRKKESESFPLHNESSLDKTGNFHLKSKKMKPDKISLNI